MRNRYSDFIQVNQELWSKVPTSKDSNGLFLVEPQSHPIISHANAVFARIIKEAKGMSIGWIDSGDGEIQERLASYDYTSRTVPLSRLTHTDKLVVLSTFARSALKMLLTGSILSFSLDGVPFGDILYDSYLAGYKVATIPRVNKGVLSTLLTLIYNYYRFKRTLQDCGASAVLVSHQVGLSSGVLMRTALGCGLHVYLRSAGTIKVTLNLFKSLSEIYQYPYKPRSIDMPLLSAIDEATLDREFQDLMEKRTNPHYDKDAGRAYNEKKKVYHSKSEFANDFQVSAAKRFVFVMLHAFNDHPHSHFGKMLFKDYYDWFIQTLEFAKTKSDVNWIFKEHPTAAFYPTRDILLPDLFENCPDHIVFLDADSSFNSKSLLYIADAVVTVLGTAGVEFAAAGGIPSILAGPSSYSGFGFTVEPNTQTEYFQVLTNIEKISRLTKSQQDIARNVFLYIQQYSYVPFSWCPFCSYEETKDHKIDSYYWDRVVQQYREKPGILMRQYNDYVRRIKQSDFTRLSNFPALEVANNN